MRAAVWCVWLAAGLTLGWLLMEYMPGAWPLICAVLVSLLAVTTHYLIFTSPKKERKDHVVQTHKLDDS